MKTKRAPKSKPEIVHDIKQVQEAERKRKIVREVIHPFLLELNSTIGFTKIFLQSSASAVESAFIERQRTTKVSEVIPRLKEVFAYKDETKKAEMEKYIRLFELLKDESVHDFIVLIQMLPRVIEQYFTSEVDKNPIMEVPIDKLLG